jgi:hypothetical protein
VGKNMEKSSWILISNYLDDVLVSGVLDFVQLNTDEVALYFADFSMVHRDYTNHRILAI